MSSAAASAQSERDYLAAVLELLGVLGWRAVHTHPLRTKHGWRTGVEGPGCKGWPDVAAVRGDRVLVAELKAGRGRLTEDQEIWLGMLARAGVETHVWRAGVDSLQAIAEVLR
jgi:hypothetical protein